MYRRHVLAGLATAGVSLVAGCSSGNNSDNGSGDNDSGGNGTSQSNNAAGTPHTSGDSETVAATVTPAATTIAKTTQQTAIQTATPVPTATVTSTIRPQTTSVAPSTASGTLRQTTATGSMNIDLSNRKTYTNDTYSYSIEYPVGWSVVDTNATDVIFSTPGVPVYMHVSTNEIPPSTTLDKATATFLRRYKQGAEQDNANLEILNRQRVTLSNGNPAVLFNIQVTPGSVNIRQKLIITLANNTLYAAAVAIPERAYTSTIGQQMTEILMSLTVSDST